MLKTVRAIPLPFGKTKSHALLPMATLELLSRLSKQTPSKPQVSDEKAIDRDDRQAHRFTPRRTAVTLTLADGKKLPGRIINVSSLAVAIEADLRKVDPGAIRLVGERPVTQGRRIALGHVFVFEKPLTPDRCQPDLLL